MGGASNKMFKFSQTELSGFSDAVRKALSRDDDLGDDYSSVSASVGKSRADNLLRAVSDFAKPSGDDEG